MGRPSVLVFDVNETLIAIESLEPHFERMFGDRRVLREWFAQLVMYSMTITLSGQVRLVTLTNSPPNPGVPTPLEHAGLGHHFERQFSVDTWRVFKPARQLHIGVADELGVAPSACMMVAAHVWDTMGAQAAGFSGALITRPGNALLPADGLPQPTIVAADIGDLAEQLR